MKRQKALTNHEEIRQWAQQRNASPAVVRGTGREDDPGVLRFDFPDEYEEDLQDIDWQTWFSKFEDFQLAVVCQEHTDDGMISTFNKIVRRFAET